MNCLIVVINPTRFSLSPLVLSQLEQPLLFPFQTQLLCILTGKTIFTIQFNKQTTNSVSVYIVKLKDIEVISSMWQWLPVPNNLSEWLWAVLLALAGLWWLRSIKTMKGLPPGPNGLPFVGYLPWIDSRAPYRTFAELSHRYGRVYSLQLGNMLAVFVSDPDLVRQAFSRPVFSGRAPLYLTHGIMQGHGIKLFTVFSSSL